MKTSILVLASAAALTACAVQEDAPELDVTDDPDSALRARPVVRPVLQCVWYHGDGTYEALFGYENRSAATVRVAHGTSNQVQVLGGDGAPSGEPPSLFRAGAHTNVVSVRAAQGAMIVWQLGAHLELAHPWSRRCSSPPVTGRSLFTTATFGGNGRTCSTCHSATTGSLSPADVAARSPDDPLFRWDGLDDFQSGTERIRRDATFLVRIPLPPNVRLADDPAATSVVVRRGVPSTLNTPALDPVLMADGRAPNLAAQAHGAIMDHAQAPAPASDADLARIAELQHTEAFFSSPAMVEASFFGRPPTLPEGTTPAERRGRDFFLDQPIGPNLEGVCAACHSGPMLNRTNQHLSVVNPGLVAGLRFLDLGLSDLNLPGYPVHDFIITLPDRSERSITSPDLGRLFISGNPIQVNSFKIPTLWGSHATAPYFHDNSARTIEEVFDHYDRYFSINLGRTLTPLQRADIKAYLELLR